MNKSIIVVLFLLWTEEEQHEGVNAFFLYVLFLFILFTKLHFQQKIIVFVLEKC